MKRSPADFFCPESFIVICTFDVSIGFREQLQPRTGGHWKNSWSDASRSSCCNAAGIVRVPEDTAAAFVVVVMLKHSAACFPSILHVSSKTPSLLSRTNTSSTCPVLLAVVPSPVLCSATNGVAAGLKLSIDWVWPLSVRKLGSPSPPAVRAWLPCRQHYAFAIYRLQLSVIEMQKTKKKVEFLMATICDGQNSPLKHCKALRIMMITSNTFLFGAVILFWALDTGHPLVVEEQANAEPALSRGGLAWILWQCPPHWRRWSLEPTMIKSIAVKSVRKAQSSELVKKAQTSSSLSLRKAQSKELVGTFGQVVKKKIGGCFFIV